MIISILVLTILFSLLALNGAVELYERRRFSIFQTKEKIAYALKLLYQVVLGAFILSFLVVFFAKLLYMVFLV